MWYVMQEADPDSRIVGFKKIQTLQSIWYLTAAKLVDLLENIKVRTGDAFHDKAQFIP
jgi:hypothetical protein